jgi:hypothetical protein
LKFGLPHVSDFRGKLAAGMHFPIWQNRHEIKGGSTAESRASSCQALFPVMPQDV